MSASMNLALHDAATNCARDGATAILTLRSGVQITGGLEKLGGADLGTRHVKTETGWATITTDEIVAVEVFK
jgi:hypothetical protein